MRDSRVGAVVLGDGSAAFEPAVLAADLREVAGLYAQLRPYVDTPAWRAPTRGWTMAQTVAHLDVMTATGLSAIDDAVAGRRPVFDGIADRRGLEAWNETTIRHRLDEGGDPLGSLVTGLRRSADRAEQLTVAQLTATVELPIYNAPLSVVDLLGIQTFHPGLTHTAQVVDAVDRPPLWAGLQPATRHRMITRLARALGYLYWPDRGGPDGLTIGIPHRRAWRGRLARRGHPHGGRRRLRPARRPRSDPGVPGPDRGLPDAHQPAAPAAIPAPPRPAAAR